MTPNKTSSVNILGAGRGCADVGASDSIAIQPGDEQQNAETSAAASGSALPWP